MVGDDECRIGFQSFFRNSSSQALRLEIENPPKKDCLNVRCKLLVFRGSTVILVYLLDCQENAIGIGTWRGCFCKSIAHMNELSNSASEVMRGMT